MSKKRMFLILSALWLFAIVSPSIITIIDSDQTSVVSTLNELEEQEQGENNFDGKEIMDKIVSRYSLSPNFTYSKFYPLNPVCSLGTSATMDIILPPPERA